jgi:cytochrome c55X
MKRALVLFGLLIPLGMAIAAEPALARQHELVRLVRQDCGSCHGMQLTGGLGLPLTVAALKDKPFDGLVATVMYGRPGSAMPPWKSIVTEAEAEWIVRQLMAGFPEEAR